MEPVFPKKGRALAFALLGGLAIAFGAAFARDQFDASLKTAADVRRHTGLEVLAVLPDRS
jgi:capsular polysaccharide biosynthesis protein